MWTSSRYTATEPWTREIGTLMTAVVQYVRVGPRHATTMGWQVGGTRLVSMRWPYGIRGAGSDHPTSGRSTNKYRS